MSEVLKDPVHTDDFAGDPIEVTERQYHFDYAENPAQEPEAYPEEILRDSNRRVTSDTVGDYIRVIAKVPLLDGDQEVELSKAIEAGVFATHKLETEAQLDDTYAAELTQIAEIGQAAYNRMVESNLRLVVSIAKRYTGCGLDMVDIIQEGNLGLQHAVEKFDYEKGYKFSTYATWWIRQAIAKGIADQARTIRLPVHTVELFNKMQKIARELQLAGEPATYERIAEVADVPLERVQEVYVMARDPASLDATITNHTSGDAGETDQSFGNMIAGDDGSEVTEPFDIDYMQHMVVSALRKCLDEDRLHNIVTWRYGLDGSERLTFQAIGERLGVSRERVRQLDQKIMKKLYDQDELRILWDTYFNGKD